MRSTNEADELKEKVDGLGYKNNALKHRYPMAELGLKVFGNEISFWSAEGPDEIVKSLEKLNPKLRVLEILSGKVSYLLSVLIKIKKKHLNQFLNLSKNRLKKINF